MAKLKLIKAQSYEALTKVKLPIVPEANALNLDREVQLFRALVADGLSTADDRKVQSALMTIATLLAKTQKVSKVPLMAKEQLHAYAKKLASITADVTGLDVTPLEERLANGIEKECNLKDDFK